MNDSFKKVKILDNFYQTSFFYPMPVVIVTTVSESGITNIGPYSLVFPFGIAGKHSMMLISRFDSNTSLNIQRTKLAALNFIPNAKSYLSNTVSLGYPGQTAEEKQKASVFKLVPSMRDNMVENVQYPEIICEAFEIMECTWNDDPEVFFYKGSKDERHFLLNIDTILMKPVWYEALLKGNGRFPSMPVDYGYRDSRYFWFARHARPYREAIPADKGIDVNSIIYQVQRLPYDLEWDARAYEKLVKVPRIFLKRVLEGISERAIAEGKKRITPELLDEYSKKRR